MQSLREAEEAKASAMMHQRCIKIDTAGCVFPQVGPPSLPPSLPYPLAYTAARRDAPFFR